MGGATFALAKQVQGLMLQRTDRDTGADADVLEGYRDDPDDFDSFNGAGTLELPPGTWTLSSIGDAITVAIRWRMTGGDPTGLTGPVAKEQQLIGLPGRYQANPELEAGPSFVIPDPAAALPRIALRRYNAGLPSTEEFAGVSIPTDIASLFVFVLTRVSDGVSVAIHLNGVSVGSFTTILDPVSIDLTRVVFGDAIESDGSFSQAAAWARALTAAEIASIDLNLNCDNYTEPTGGPQTSNPMIAPDGTSLISPDLTTSLRRPVDVVESEPGRIERRRLNEYVPRVYELSWEAAPADEVERVTRAYQQTRQAGWTRWRHPQDDPPAAAGNAPRWRIVNELELTRDRAGATAAMRVVLEEVVS
ncbi:MAG: hypothetical protein AAF108_02920 [Planctomycetota bacterium]